MLLALMGCRYKGLAAYIWTVWTSSGCQTMGDNGKLQLKVFGFRILQLMQSEIVYPDSTNQLG